MKTCIKCNIEKEEAEFAFKSKKKHLRQTICKECHRKYSKDDYRNKKQYYLDKAARNSRLCKERNQDYLLEYFKLHPCVDCGNSDIRILTFDHIKGEKDNNVSSMIHKHSWDTILKEIRKCEVRCWNCHMLRHVIENKWRMWQPI